MLTVQENSANYTLAKLRREITAQKRSIRQEFKHCRVYFGEPVLVIHNDKSPTLAIPYDACGADGWTSQGCQQIAL